MLLRVLSWLLICPCFAAVAQDLPPVLSEQQRQQQNLYSTLQHEAYDALDRRLERFETLKTKDDIAAYQNELRAKFVDRLGGFPSRSPLNERTLATIEADGYVIEKVIFDSRPNHRITANLYLPDGDGPFPAVVVSSGHSRTAKTADYNQRFGIMMARHGMAALCFDPIGQGERSQILNDDGANRVSGTTTEHFLVGIGSILVGRNTATYRIYDAMRAIDYLSSRPEIDAARIGMTGCSGGGTLTSYTMALDDRVLCAAPSCYLTTLRRLIETIGPQDSEQNIYGQLSWGMDQTDYVLMRAPKPTLISSTTQDFFDIQGSWDNFRQSKRIYGRLGFPERVDLVEIEGNHGVTPQNLATIAHWMQRWLIGRDEPVEAIELQVRDGAELQVTEKGQVLLLPTELSVFDLNAEKAKQLARSRAAMHRSLSDDSLREQIAARIGLSGIPTTPEAQSIAKQTKDIVKIEAVLLDTGTATPLPTYVFRPTGDTNGITYLCLHDDGKTGFTDRIPSLVEKGHVVVTVDLRGQGETAGHDSTKNLGDWKTFYLAYLLEKSIVGMRTYDVIAAARYANSLVPESESLHLMAAGQSGIVALHAAALQPTMFQSVTLQDTPSEWSTDVGTNEPETNLDHTVHGALELYDLPDLVRLAGDDRVTTTAE